LIIGSILTGLCAIGFAAGIALLAVAYGMPAHSDEPRATRLTIQYEQNYLSATPEQKASIQREISSLRTSKWERFNAGLVLSLTALVGLIAIIRFKLWDVRMLRSATTPRTRSRLLGLASVAWLSLLPALLFELDDEYTQDDLTPTIDTGHGAFLVDGPIFFITIWMVILLVGRFVLRNACLPANLWIWNRDRQYFSVAWTILYGVLGGIIAALILFTWSTRAVGWGLPSLTIGLYVIASTRAALLSRNLQPSSRIETIDQISTTT